MGFDPRRWSSAAGPHRRQTVTSNVDALLAENDSLRRQVLQLKRQLDVLRQRSWSQHPSRQQHSSDAPRQQQREITPSVSTDQVERWGEALAHQQGWNTLRLNELEQLIDALNRASFHPHLNLQQRLDRLMPGLGADLFAATHKPVTKKRCAVLAAFALYGIRSREWLDEDPQRVVFELKSRQQSTQKNRRTRSDQRASDRNSQSYGRANKSSEFSIGEALLVLGLKRGASLDSIKKSYRRLVKQHHPDLGGSVDQFRKVNEAYQQLMMKG
jgi:DnaJ-domain-containing protein 1